MKKHEIQSIEIEQGNGALSTSVQDLVFEAKVSVTKVRSGDPKQAPLILLGSEKAWFSMQSAISEQLDSAIPVVRISFRADTEVRTVHGVADRLLKAILALHPVATPLCVLSQGNSVRVAHCLAIRCLMLDLPVGFVGAIDMVDNDRRCAEDELLDRIGEEAHSKEYLGRYVDLHWFSDIGSLPEELLQKRMRMWRPRTGAPEHVAECITAALKVARSKPVTVTQQDSLLTVQAGRKGLDPYFCLAGAGANVTDFVPFSLAIGDANPVFGLQSRGLYEDQIPDGSVESAARRYVELIDAHYPTGGLHLVGHSFGGWLAFEMAVRLQTAGREVRSLTVFDTEAPGHSKTIGREYTRPEAMMLFVGILEQASGRSFNLDIHSLLHLSCEAIVVLLHKKMVDLGMLPFTSSPDHLSGPVLSFEAALRTNYSPVAPFFGPTRLVMACSSDETPQSALTRYRDVAENWRRLTPKLNVFSSAGNHVKLLRDPHIVEVVSWLRDLSVTTVG
jgi:thioesterase domain-containing protein